MLPRLVGAMKSLPPFSSLAESLPARKHEATAGGLPGSAPAVLLAALAEALPQRQFLVVTPGPAEAERWLADLGVLTESARLYPQREALGEEEPHLEIAGERVETIADMLGGGARIVVTTLRATVERTRMPAAVGGARLDLAVGRRLRPQELIDRLEAMGYERKPSVLDVAQLAVRGGIIDLYGFGMAGPARIEWADDAIETMRYFDLDSQRSERETDSITVLPVQADERISGSADEGNPDSPLIRSSADPPRQSL